MKKRIYSLALACMMLAAMLLPCAAFAAPDAVESISVAPQLSLVAGESAQLDAKAQPNRYRNAALTYSSSKSSVATVDEKGVVTAVKKGSATITILAENGAKATVALKVVAKGEPTGISLNYEKLELGVKGTDQLIPTLTPKEGITTKNQVVSFKSSNSKVVKVDKKGNLAGVKAGTATITAKTRNGFSAKCVVTVSNIKVEPTKIVFAAASLSLPAGKTEQLSVGFTPSNTTEKTLTYSSNNPAVATVDSKGIVTGIKEGRATITAKTANGKTANCNVAVTKGAGIPVTSIRLSTNFIELGVRESATLSASVLPANATDKSLTFIVRDGSVASIDKNGRVTGLRAGETTIDVFSGNNMKETCTVVVTSSEVPVGRVELNYTSKNLKLNESFSLGVQLSPPNATNKSITFASSNTSVASVNANGLVTALRAGKATITATAGNGVSAQCEIVVAEEPAPAPQETAGYMEDVLYYTNLEREKAGLSPLRLHSKLSAAASIRANEIISKFDHTRPDGRGFHTVLPEANVSGYTTAGENLAAGQRTAQAVVNAWMDSPGHRANILSSKYSYLGVGYVTHSDAYGHYWVQLFMG